MFPETPDETMTTLNNEEILLREPEMMIMNGNLEISWLVSASLLSFPLSSSRKERRHHHQHFSPPSSS